MIRLLELRQEKGLTQREIAKAMFVSQGTYNNWENGRTQPSIEQLVALSRFFGETVDYLIGNGSSEKQDTAVNKTDKDAAAEIIKEIEYKHETLKKIM